MTEKQTQKQKTGKKEKGKQLIQEKEVMFTDLMIWHSPEVSMKEINLA